VKGLWPNSGVVVLPIRIAPARLRRATATASTCGTVSEKRREPEVVRTPAVCTRSLAENGTPKRDGKQSRPRIWVVAARPSARACSAATVMKALAPRRCSIRSSTASTASSGEIAPRRIASANETASSDAMSDGTLNWPLAAVGADRH
jgi:hypothetical protein